MKNYKLPIIIAGLVLASTALADVASLVTAIQTDTANEAKLETSKQSYAQANASLDKEQKLYADQIKNRLGPIKAAIESDTTRFGADVAKYNDGVGRHNASCAGTLPRPAYERCQGEKRYWDGRKSALEGQKDRLLARANDFDRQLRPYTKRLDEIATQTQRNTAAIADAERSLAATRAHLVQLKQQLVEACKTTTKPEELKYCHDLSWANAQPGLPPL